MIKTKNNSQIIITIALAIIAIAILTGALCTTSYQTVSAEQSAGAVENLPTESDNVPAIEQNVLATNNNDYYMGDTQVLILINWNGTSSWEDATTYTITTNVVYYKKVKQLGFSIQSTVENFAEINEFVKKSPTVIGKAYPYDSIGIELRNIKVVSEESRIRFNQLDVEMTIDDNGFDYVEIYLELPKYKITWDSNGGHYTDNWQALNPRDYVPGNFFYLAPYPSKDGYNCIGWEYNGKIYTYAQVNENNYVFTDRNDLSFIAKYEVITYTITYKNIATMHQSSSGVNILKLRDNSQTYTIDNTPYALLSLDTDAYRETAGGIPFYTNGYDTIGWIPEEYVTVGDNTITYDKTQAITELALGTYGNKTFYRVFEPHYYEIFYDWNGGSYDNWQAGSFPSSFSPAIKVNINSAGPPSRNAYKFTGWKVDGTDTIITEGEQFLNYTNDITLIAQWQAINYTITYKTYGIANNTLFIEIERNYANYTIENTPLTLQSNPEKDAVTLVSWIPSDCVTITDNGIITYDKTKATRVLEEGTYGDRTFYAFYEPIYYQITYDWNGGSYDNWQAGSFPSSFSPLVEVNINSAGPPSRNAYKFTGWKVDGTDTIITEGKQFLNYTNDITLIAQWQTVEYSILYKFIGNDNKLRGLNFTHKYTIEDNVVLEDYYNNPTAGHKISKWHRLSDFDIDEADNFTQEDMYFLKNNATTISGWSAGEQYGDITIYAAEVVNWWDIKYYWNGSEVEFRTPPTMYRYTYNYFIPTYDLPKASDIKPIKIGSSDKYYIIEGWYDNPNFTGKQVTQITQKSSGNKNFYLKTRTTAKINYKIIYLDEESSIEEDAAPDTHRTFMQNIGDNFKIDYICTYAYKLDWFIPVLNFMGNLSYTTEYKFVGWSRTKYTYKDWKNATESTYRSALVNDNDFEITNDVDLYGCFVKTNSNFKFKWMWDTKFKVYTDNKYLDARDKQTGQTDGKYIVTYGWLIDKANADNETVLWKEQFYQKDGEKLILPNTEEFLADINNYVSVDGIIFGVNYKFLGWTRVGAGQALPDLNVWKSLRNKEDIDKYELLTDESDITVDGNYYLFAIFVGESVYRSIFGGEPEPDSDIPINTPDGEGTPNWISALMAFFGINKNSGVYGFINKMSNGGFTFAELWEYNWFKVVIIVIGIIIAGAILGLIIKISTAIKTAKTAGTVNKLSRQIKQKELEELKKKNE